MPSTNFNKIPADARAISNAVRKNIAEGEVLVARAHDDFGLIKHHSDDDGPLTRDWKRGAFPAKRPLSSHVALPEVPSMADMVTMIVASEQKSKNSGLIAAGLGLIKLREWFEAVDPEELPNNQRTWPQFVAKRLPFGIDRANELMGPLLHRKELLQCSKCSAKAVSQCGCGAAYISIHQAEEGGTKPGFRPGTNKGGRPPLHDKPMSHAERNRRYRAAKRAKTPAPTDYEDPNSYRNAYMLRADQAGAMAFYAEAEIVDDDILASAEYAMNAWQNLFQRLNKGRTSHGEKAKQTPKTRL